MRWTPGGRSPNLEDRRSMGGGIGRGLGLGGTVVVLALSLIFGRNLFSDLGVSPAVGATSTPMSPADSAAAVQAMDLARERLIQLARYKVLTVPKSKICEALAASGFTWCDILLTEQQGSQLARSLSVNAFTTGTLGHNSASYTARIRVSEGSSGFGMVFTATGRDRKSVV